MRSTLHCDCEAAASVYVIISKLKRSMDVTWEKLFIKERGKAEIELLGLCMAQGVVLS